MILKVVLLLLYIHMLVNTVNALRCYLCGIENAISCESFDPNNSSFMINCPKKSSCGLQTHGNMEIRTCEDQRFDDCQKANNIEYCYCTRDLCNVNGKAIHFSPSDDEDEVEGSGSTTIPTITFNPVVTIVPKSARGNQETSRCNMFVLNFMWFILLALK